MDYKRKWYDNRGEFLDSHQVKLLDKVPKHLMDHREQNGRYEANWQYTNCRKFLVEIGVRSISERVLRRHAAMVYEVFEADNIGV